MLNRQRCKIGVILGMYLDVPFLFMVAKLNGILFLSRTNVLLYMFENGWESFFLVKMDGNLYLLLSWC